eukprot:4306962-Amphidinium_carterae.1
MALCISVLGLVENAMHALQYAPGPEVHEGVPEVSACLNAKCKSDDHFSTISLPASTTSISQMPKKMCMESLVQND